LGPFVVKEEAMPTLKLRSVEIAKTTVIPPPGGAATDLGTRRVFSEDLREQASSQVVGQHSGTCTLVRKPAFWLCHAGWTLESVGPGPGKTGSLVAGGLLNFNADPPFVVAIWGGTGDHDKARGEITGLPIPNTDPQEYDWEIEIVG
jgi:hypothetical protein